MPLHVIDGTHAAKAAGMLQCPRCGGREVVETRIGATATGGGTKAKLCLACLMHGERVVIV